MQHSKFKRVVQQTARFLPCILPLLATIILVFVLIGMEDDVELFFIAVRKAYPVFSGLVELFTDYGNVPYYLAFGVILAIGIRRREKGLVATVLYYGLTLAITLFLVEIGKIATGRPRPPVDGDFEPFSLERGYQSFPSAHVTETLVTTMSLAQSIGGTVTHFFFGLSPALMALSRLYLGHHHPSDCIGSIIFAVLGMHLSALLVRLICSKLPGKGRWFGRSLVVLSRRIA